MGKGGHCTICWAAICCAIAGICGLVSIGSPWWGGDTPLSGKIKLSLWKISFEWKVGIWTGVKELDKKHDDMCKGWKSGPIKDYCDVLAGARTSAILTGILGWFAAVWLICEFCKHREYKLIVGIILAGATFGCAVPGIPLGLYLEENNFLVKKPSAGFIAIIMACVLSAAGFVLAIYGAIFSQWGGCCKRGHNIFQDRAPVGNGAIVGYGNMRAHQKPPGSKGPPCAPQPQLIPVAQPYPVPVQVPVPVPVQVPQQNQQPTNINLNIRSTPPESVGPPAGGSEGFGISAAQNYGAQPPCPPGQGFGIGVAQNQGAQMMGPPGSHDFGIGERYR